MIDTNTDAHCANCAALAPNDAARIPQPTYKDLWDAYMAGAKSGQKHGLATSFELGRAADAWCKLLHAQRDPEGFVAMSSQNAGADGRGVIDQPSPAKEQP